MIKNYFRHLKTVLHHKNLVLLYSFKVGIPLQGIMHDLSKFRPSEFNLSVKYFQGFETPCLKERRENNNYSMIAVTHTNRNKHHFEYWVDILKGNLILRKIPFKYCLEYCIDGISASKTYSQKSFTSSMPLDYFSSRKDRYLMHPASKEFILKTYELFKESGFKNIKKSKLKSLYKIVNEKYPETYEVKINLDTSLFPIVNEKKDPL